MKAEQELKDDVKSIMQDGAKKAADDMFTPSPSAETVESIEELVARRKHTPQKHFLQSLGMWAWFIPLSALDQRELNRMQVKKSVKLDEITGKETDSWDFDPVGLPLAGVALAWTNTKGDRLRGNRAIEAVGQLDPAVITEAWEIVQKITNWGNAEKNSDKNRGGDASSSSR
jgi:hypothetical protein